MGRADRDDAGPVARILQPVGAETFADRQHGFTGVFGKFERPRKPIALPAITVVLDKGKPAARQGRKANGPFDFRF